MDLRPISKNHLLDLIEPSRSVVLLSKIKKLKAENPDILNLTAGEPDFDTPEPILREVSEQLRLGCTHYSDSKGDPALRRAISQKLHKENRAPYGEENILITPGGKYAVYLAIQTLLNPGDEVLWLSPGWVSYPAIITLCGGKAVQVPLSYEDHYTLTCGKLEQYTTSRTRLLIINYPNNPTGRILTEKELCELKAFLRNHPDIYCLSDEIYEKLIYDKKPFLSPASDPELFERVLVVNGFSKSCAMTGFRIGYLALPSCFFEGALKIFQHSMSCTSLFIQKAALTALSLPEETERMRAAYETRRNLIYKELKEVPRISFSLPEGAFYAWIKFYTSLSSEELCMKLLEEAKIGGIPGSAFGEENGCLVRFCYAADEKTLKEFADRLKKFAETL